MQSATLLAILTTEPSGRWYLGLCATCSLNASKNLSVNDCVMTTFLALTTGAWTLSFRSRYSEEFNLKKGCTYVWIMVWLAMVNGHALLSDSVQSFQHLHKLTIKMALYAFPSTKVSLKFNEQVCFKLPLGWLIDWMSKSWFWYKYDSDIIPKGSDWVNQGLSRGTQVCPRVFPRS